MNACLLAAHLDATTAGTLASMASRKATGAIQTLADAHVSPDDVRRLVRSSNDVAEGKPIDGVAAVGRSFAMSTDAEIGALLHAVVAGEQDGRRIDAGLDRFFETIGILPNDPDSKKLPPRSAVVRILDEAIGVQHPT